MIIDPAVEARLAPTEITLERTVRLPDGLPPLASPGDQFAAQPFTIAPLRLAEIWRWSPDTPAVSHHVLVSGRQIRKDGTIGGRSRVIFLEPGTDARARFAAYLAPAGAAASLLPTAP